VDEQGNEIDPREELVQALLDYKRFKEIVEVLKDFEGNRALTLFTWKSEKRSRKSGKIISRRSRTGNHHFIQVVESLSAYDG
jgi:chromatin segregation and condensation protein Rec8/ScpA/Scc1 (kleisin family)